MHEETPAEHLRPQLAERARSNDHITYAPSSALAGVSTVTVLGTNFSPVIASDIVYFDATPAAILSASPTQISVRAPDLVKDSIKVTVSALGSQYFSNYVSFNLKAAVITFGGLASTETPYGVECDTAGNVYASMVSGGTGIGIKKFTPAERGPIFRRRSAPR